MMNRNVLNVLVGVVAVVSAKRQYFPQRSSEDSALLEWGHSAVIHAADAVVSEFGLQAPDQEFELGIEASPVFAKPSQGCEPLRNSAEVQSQMVFMFRGGPCDFKTKVDIRIVLQLLLLLYTVLYLVIRYDSRSATDIFSIAASSCLIEILRLQ